MLTVGLVSVVQPSFWGSSENLYVKHYIPKMKALSDELKFNLLAWEKTVVTESDSAQACAFFENNKTDFILIQATTFPGGDVILPFANVKARIGLWGIPEITEDKAIPLNSFCGINMLSSILGQYLDSKKLIKWFFGDVDDAMFIDRFKVTIRALNGVTKIQGAKIALVGGIAPGFADFSFDERTTYSKLGVRVNRLPEFGDIKDRALSYSSEEIKEEIECMKADSACVCDNAEKNLENTARVYKAFIDFIEEGNYDAIAIGCWPKYRKEFGIVACSVIGRLLEKGYIAACEGDIDSAISMLLMKHISGSEPMLMDLSKFNTEKEQVLMWHCGSAPSQYADGKGMCLATHYKPGKNIPAQDDVKVGTVQDMYFKAQPATIARFTWDYKKMLVFTGDFVDNGDRSYDGSRGWMGNLKQDGKKLPLNDLINTVMVQRFQHHYPIVAGNIEEEIYEAMAWLNILPLDTIPYRNYLQNTHI